MTPQKPKQYFCPFCPEDRFADSKDFQLHVALNHENVYLIMKDLLQIALKEMKKNEEKI